MTQEQQVDGPTWFHTPLTIIRVSSCNACLLFSWLHLFSRALISVSWKSSCCASFWFWYWRIAASTCRVIPTTNRTLEITVSTKCQNTKVDLLCHCEEYHCRAKKQLLSRIKLTDSDCSAPPTGMQSNLHHLSSTITQKKDRKNIHWLQQVK